MEMNDNVGIWPSRIAAFFGESGDCRHFKFNGMILVYKINIWEDNRI